MVYCNTMHCTALPAFSPCRIQQVTQPAINQSINIHYPNHISHTLVTIIYLPHKVYVTLAHYICICRPLVLADLRINNFKSIHTCKMIFAFLFNLVSYGTNKDSVIQQILKWVVKLLTTLTINKTLGLSRENVRKTTSQKPSKACVTYSVEKSTTACMKLPNQTLRTFCSN